MESHQLNSTSSSSLKGAMDSEGAYSNSDDANQVLALPLLYLLLSQVSQVQLIDLHEVPS